MSGSYTQITRTIESALEAPEESDVLGTVLDPKGGIIELPIPLINFRGRAELGISNSQIFDPEEHFEDLPADRVERCVALDINVRKLASYRKYGTVYLNRIQVCLNRLIDAVKNYQTGSHPNVSEARKFLQGAFSAFEDVVINTLAGKGGLIVKNVAGLRLPFSMMTPAAGTHLCEHNEVLIPLSEAKTIRAWDGNIIMVHREPLLHGPGIVFLKARVVPDQFADSTRIPWAVFFGMNADCDGDLIFLTNITEHLKSCTEEERTKVLDEITRVTEVDMLRHKFSASLRLLNADEQPKYEPERSSWPDLRSRLDDSEAISFGVEDIFGDQSKHAFLEILNAHLDIDPAKILKYATDLKEEDWSQDIRETTKALCYTKRGLGIVGAIGNYALVISSYHRNCIDAAVDIKERLSQTILDAKHGEDLDHINECLNSLMKAGEYEEASIEQRIQGLVRNGFDREVIAPLFRVLGDIGIVTYVYQNFPGFLMATSNTNVESLFIRFTEQASDLSGPGRDAGAWWDNAVVPLIEEARQHANSEDS